MPEWLKGADCKSAASCYVGSNPTRPINYLQKFNKYILIKLFSSLLKNFLNLFESGIYKPTILMMIAYKTAINTRNPTITKIRSFLILNKFLNGAKITKIKPAKLLIKNRG